MKNRAPRIVIGTLVVLCAAAGYGVYWWHEATLQADDPLRGAPDDDQDLLRVRKLLVREDAQDRVRARRLVESLPEQTRIEVLLALARDSMASIRRFACASMGSLRDNARIRAVLARLAQSDRDPGVRTEATQALAGEP